ncbi:MAG TPA: response regulator transcription factor [Acidimicrobiales bacterium]|nr:response regulator transcription factor [Acidimicrobiales bacterium]
MLSVFLVDDHEVVRRGVRELLEREGDIEVVGEAGRQSEALVLIPEAKPDVVLLDVRLPDGDGIEICRDIRSASPEIHCLMLTSYADDEALVGAVMAGAAGYVLKQINGNDLVASVRRAARGESLLDPLLVAQARARLGRDREEERLKPLSPQERKILDLIAEGKTNREIAETMFLAEKTVRNYVSNLLMKMGMKHRTEAAVFAVHVAERERKSFSGPE